MENIEDKNKESLTDKISDYIDTRIKLVKLTAVESLVTGIASAVSGIVLLFLGLFAVLFLSLALGFLLSELIGNTYAGFFIVSFIYILLAVIIFYSKDKLLETPIINKLIVKLLKEEDK